MARKISKAGVGAFVVCGVLLLVLGIVALGGKSMLNKNVEYSLYFDGSVNGLSLGAPVVFRGVPLGSVTKISLVPNRKEGRGVLIAVKVQLSPEAFGGRNGGEVSESVRHRLFKRMVDNGLRARLHLNSVITGQYRVDLDLFPDAPPVYYSNNPDLEIPTILSPLDNLAKTLEGMPLQDMANELRNSLTKLSALLSNGDLDAALKDLRTTLRDTAEIAENLKGNLASAGKELPGAMASFRLAMDQVASAAKSADGTARTASALLDNNSPVIRKLQQSMQDFSAASRSMRELAETLERNPEAMLLGKGNKRR